MRLVKLNLLNTEDLKPLLSKCCGAEAWVEKMANNFPFNNEEELFKKAESIWFGCSEKDWLEAFTHHPKIGDINSLREKFANTSKWAEGEQAGVNNTTEAVLNKLAKGNSLYEDKFGYIFIVCATGKSAEEMLAILESRLPNSPEKEIKIAMGEQNKITQIRLQKLLAS